MLPLRRKSYVYTYGQTTPNLPFRCLDIWVATAPTFVMIVKGFIQLEDNFLLLLKEFPPDRHQILLFLNSHPDGGEINQNLDPDDGDGDGDSDVDVDGDGDGDGE